MNYYDVANRFDTHVASKELAYTVEYHQQWNKDGDQQITRTFADNEMEPHKDEIIRHREPLG